MAIDPLKSLVDGLTLLVACVSCLIGFVLGVATLVVISATMLSSQHSRGEEQDAQTAPPWAQVKGHWE